MHFLGFVGGGHTTQTEGLLGAIGMPGRQNDVPAFNHPPPSLRPQCPPMPTFQARDDQQARSQRQASAGRNGYQLRAEGRDAGPPAPKSGQRPCPACQLFRAISRQINGSGVNAATGSGTAVVYVSFAQSMHESRMATFSLPYPVNPSCLLIPQTRAPSASSCHHRPAVRTIH